MYKLLFGTVLLLAPMSVWAQRVTTDYNHKTNFSEYHTYAWRSREGMGSHNAFQDGFLDQRLREAVDRELQSKGWVETNNSPDVYVTYYAGTRERENVANFPYVVDPWFWGYWNDVMVTHYIHGTFIIDMIDAHTNHLVWRAYATDNVDRLPQLEKAKTIDKIAEKAFDKFPPQKD